MSSSTDEGARSEERRGGERCSSPDTDRIRCVAFVLLVSALLTLAIGCAGGKWIPIMGYEYPPVPAAVITVLMTLYAAGAMTLARGIDAGRQRSAVAFLLTSWLVFAGVLAHLVTVREGVYPAALLAVMVVCGHRELAKTRRAEKRSVQ